MKRILALLAGVLAAPAAWAQAEVTLTRLDCGTNPKPVNVSERFNDTFSYGPEKLLNFTYSCYVIKHGNDYMVWDTGFVPGSNPNAPKVSLGDQLKQLNISPDQVKFVGISHYHPDHTSQLPTLLKSTLLIGKGDWDGIVAKAPGVNTAPFTHWVSGGGSVEPQAIDKDVFGDGTVVMLRTPGHTPGHSSLLVRLRDKGPVILMGDLAHFQENYESGGVPAFNFDRAATVASLDRVKKLAANMKATVIIQHDPRDIGKLPAFPAAAR